MSAVSSEPHEPASEPGHRDQATTPEPAAAPADFGANEWLVEELYQRYLADPGSVDRAWWSFFADYQPTIPNGTGPQPVIGIQSAAPAAQPPAAAPPVQRARSVGDSGLVIGEEAPPGPVNGTRVREVALVQLLDQPFVGAEIGLPGRGLLCGLTPLTPLTPPWFAGGLV